MEDNLLDSSIIENLRKLSKICFEVDYSSKKSVSVNNKSMDEIRVISSKLTLEARFDLLHELININEYDLNHQIAFVILENKDKVTDLILLEKTFKLISQSLTTR